jgi:hypothetical protein
MTSPRLEVVCRAVTDRGTVAAGPVQQTYRPVVRGATLPADDVRSRDEPRRADRAGAVICN